MKYLKYFYPNSDLRHSFSLIDDNFEFYLPILGDGNCAYRSVALGFLISHKFSDMSNFFMEKGVLGKLVGNNL